LAYALTRPVSILLLLRLLLKVWLLAVLLQSWVLTVPV
jgi:hypothetical protein